MQFKKFFTHIGLPAVLLASSITAAHAERPGLYIGGAWGAYQINESNFDENDDLLKAYFGAQFNSWFSLEGSWVDFKGTNNNGNSEFKSDGKGLSAVFSFPISDSSAFYLKAGQFWWDSDFKLNGVKQDSDGNDPFYGAGFRIGINKVLSLRLEAERYDVSNTDLDTVTIGLQFNF